MWKGWDSTTRFGGDASDVVRSTLNAQLYQGVPRSPASFVRPWAESASAARELLTQRRHRPMLTGRSVRRRATVPERAGSRTVPIRDTVERTP